MSSQTATPVEFDSPLAVLDALAAVLEQVQASNTDRREAVRVPLAQDICVIGLDDHFQASTEPVLMDGRDVSTQGLSFSHALPITTRFAAVSFRVASGVETVVVKLTWCRFSRPGCYMSGGKFMKLSTPINAPRDWAGLKRG